MTDPTLLTEAEVRKLVRLAPRTLRAYVAAGKFPAPLRLGDDAHARKRWLRSEVVAWVERRAARREVCA